MNTGTKVVLASSALNNQEGRLHAYDSQRRWSIDNDFENPILAGYDIIKVSLNLECG